MYRCFTQPAAAMCLNTVSLDQSDFVKFEMQTLQRTAFLFQPKKSNLFTKSSLSAIKN